LRFCVHANMYCMLQNV